MLHIRDLTSADIPLLKDFAPPDWNTDISLVFGRHFGQPYFHATVAEWDGALVGCANGLLQGSAGWLGNIIVLPPFRGRGIGRALTEDLVNFFREKHMDHQVLVATDLGEPVYRKLGFQVISYYVFFARQAHLPAPDAVPGVRPLQPDDEEPVFALDRIVTGEKRAPFLRRYLSEACVHTDPAGRVDGYYLPELGAGLVVAANDAAGMALLRYKAAQGGSVAVVPEQNRVAVDFLRAHGFAETSRAPRMALGHDVAWQPERVYARGSGFSG